MTPEQSSPTVARFGHHPDPAIDFCVEVEAIEGEVFDQRAGLPAQFDTAYRAALALRFRVGGSPQAIAAKEALRNLIAKDHP